jgi:glycosyltransferase involved in cell wall biosynthesis
MQKIDSSIIIPVLNEEENISAIIDLIKAYDKENSEIIVVDGGSSDTTVNIANSKGVIVIADKAYNYYNAIKEGINKSIGDKILIISGYSTYQIKDILEFKSKRDTLSDFIIFTIYPKYNLNKMSLIRRKIINSLFNKTFKTNFKDIYSGFYEINSKKTFFEVFYQIKEKSEYPWLPIEEIILAYKKHNKKIEEVLISDIPVPYTEKGGILKQIFLIIKKVFVYISLLFK